MKRLLDEELGQEQEDAARLLGAARPLTPSRHFRQSVWSAVHARPVVARATWPRAALAAATVFILLGLASAMTGHFGHRRVVGPNAAHTSDVPSLIPPVGKLGEEPSSPASPAILDSAIRTDRERSAAPGAGLDPVPLAAPSSRKPGRTSATHSSAAQVDQMDSLVSRNRVEVAPVPDVATPEREQQLYLDGIDALRRAHDYRRASALFQLYRQTFPRGEFVEESWALSIEAVAELGLSPRDEARRYLARYPQGRFRALAEKALDR